MAAAEPPPKEGDYKDTSVKLYLRPVAGAPILRKDKFKINGQEPFAQVCPVHEDSLIVFCSILRHLVIMPPQVIKFVRKSLKDELAEDDALYLFCQSNFSPSPDQLLGNLYEVWHGSLLLLTLLS